VFDDQQAIRGDVGKELRKMSTSDDPLLLAMEFLRSALELLDEAGAPSDIGAHVDTAIGRLADVIDQPNSAANEARQ